MKTAILLATNKGDKRVAKLLRHGIFSEILGEFKARVASDRGEPGYDSLEIWTGPSAKVYSRFSSAAESEIPAPAEILTDDEKTARIAVLESQLHELKVELEKFQGAPPQGAEGSGPLGAATATIQTDDPGAGGGDPSGAQGDGAGASKPPAEVSPGTMTPRGKKGK